MKPQISGTTLFGRWMRQRRRSLDLTQAELAQRTGCSLVTVRKIETGERRPSKAMAETLSRALGIAPHERDRFVAFARSDQGHHGFRHPVLAPETSPPEEVPEALFAGASPGWLHERVLEPPAAYSHELLVMQLTGAPVDSPLSEQLGDGRMLCHISSRGHLSGHLNGALATETTHLVKDMREPSRLAHMSVRFELDTGEGWLKGYYAGFSAGRADGQEDLLRMRGQVLAVSNAYVDLLMAEVFYEGIILYPGAQPERAIEERGTLTILAR